MSEAYRPAACPRCQRSGLWRHGHYERKADRRVGVSADESLNPVAVPRFLCPACVRTYSPLLACVAPRRWYDWAVQQLVLLMLRAGGSVHRCAVCTVRHTVRRWRNWLCDRSEVFAFFLRSWHPEFGRRADHESFWRKVIDVLSPEQAMVLLDHDLVVPRWADPEAPADSVGSARAGPPHSLPPAVKLGSRLSSALHNERCKPMKDIDPRALFRLSVLGTLVSRERLERGELQQVIRELSEREYAM